jgi:hypothetical protein
MARLLIRLSRFCARLDRSLIHRTLMNRRLLFCGVAVGAFILTLALSFWHDGLRRNDAAPATRAVPPPPPLPAPPDAPAAGGAQAAGSASPAAAMNPPSVTPAPEPVQREPQSEPDSSSDADNGAMLARRERGTERS